MYVPFPECSSLPQSPLSLFYCSALPPLPYWFSQPISTPLHHFPLRLLALNLWICPFKPLFNLVLSAHPGSHPLFTSEGVVSGCTIINSTGISKWDPISSPSFTGCSGPQRRRSLSRPCCSLWHNNCLLHTSPYPRTLRRGWDQLAKFDACAGWLNKSSCVFYSSSAGSEVVFLSTSNAGPGPPRALYNQPDSQ